MILYEKLLLYYTGDFLMVVLLSVPQWPNATLKLHDVILPMSFLLSVILPNVIDTSVIIINVNMPNVTALNGTTHSRGALLTWSWSDPAKMFCRVEDGELVSSDAFDVLNHQREVQRRRQTQFGLQRIDHVLKKVWLSVKTSVSVIAGIFALDNFLLFKYLNIKIMGGG